MALIWRGEQVKRKLTRSSVRGINNRMAAAVALARGDHPYTTRTGKLERGTQVVEPATPGRQKVTGRWGVVGVPYARRRELGFQGKDALGRVFDDPEGPFLRPAGEATYPGLGRAIGRAFRA